MVYNTYEHESSLPSLPVPSLYWTAENTLKALKPLLSNDEYWEVQREATDFTGNDHINLLQSHLVAASRNKRHPCYLSSIDNEIHPGIYGELRGDILPRNPFLVIGEDPYAKTISPPNQAQRAATLINSSLKFIVSLRNGTLKPDLTPKSGTPLTMNCYRNLFGTTRVPDAMSTGENRVKLKKYEDVNESRHIVVICNNQFYKLEVLTPYDGEDELTKHQIWFSDHELSQILQEIIDESIRVDDIECINNSVGSLTTQSFGVWKIAREELENCSPENLETLDNALFVTSLDTKNSPTTDYEKASVISYGSSELLSGTNFQVGSCTSRWYDKLQLIVTKNSVAGIVWESTSMDSTAILRFVSDIYTDSILKLAKNINGAEHTLFDNRVSFVSSNGKITKPYASLMIFKKNPELQNLIHSSETRLTDLINQHGYKTTTIKFDSFLAKSFGFSMDSVLQISFQIAYYTLYGKMVNTLEPIMTRKLKDARTELIPIQNESISHLVKSFITNSSSQVKYDLFKECCDIHKEQYLDAMNGRGFQRHLMALLQILKRPSAAQYLNQLNPHLPPIEPLSSDSLPLPLVTNPAIDRLLSPELLISNCGNNALHLFGIPPAIDQGFGIGYIIHNEKVDITICSKHRQNERFIDTFKSIINEFKASMKQKSNFLLNINESESRKEELKMLRMEKELKNINLDHPSTRHPIEISLDPDQEPIPIENVSVEKTSEAIANSNSLSDESDKDYDLLGGYGYFDFGELGIRSDQISRNESFMNSNSSLSSKVASRSISRHHSSSNVAKLDTVHQNDIKQKLDLSAIIRDKLNDSSDSIHTLSQSSSSSGVEASRGRSKSEIGRQLDTSNL